MGMFSDLMNKIFRHPSAAPEPESRTMPSATAAEATSTAHADVAKPSMSEVDVAKVLDRMASESKQKLDWKHSIVDLMKLVGMDSSLNARRELAADLHYTGDTGDTATMNMWLHREVMKKLAENGGKVPKDLLAA